jgi:N-carbamoylputrescine amidase
MTSLTVAALQLAFTDCIDDNIGAVSELVREAAAKGAKLILPPELFEGHYFCRTQDETHFSRALPVEKFYFRPGNSGFKVWKSPYGTIGAGVCWDQWYPETARTLMLMGAEILLYPTAIGTEPHDPDLDTSRMWRRAMIGHAVSNVVPVVAANRIGTEGDQRFYGHSFICDERGDMLAEFGAAETGVLVATLDLSQARRHRAAFGFFRDRRPELYGRISQDL